MSDDEADRPVTEAELRAADGMEEAAAWSTVGIVCGSGDQTGREIGTGVTLRWKSRPLIVTAAHVLGDTRLTDLRFLFRPRRTLKRVERSDLLTAKRIPVASLERVKQIRADRPVKNDAIDLAAIPVADALEQEHTVRFFDLTVGGTSPAAGQTVLVMGYPADITRVTWRNERVAFTSTDWTKIEPNRDGLESFHPDLHLLFDYAGALEPDAHPGGFSGSAVWYRRGPTPLVWHPNLDIAGVTIAYYSRSNLLKAVRREMLERFLTDIG